MFRKIFRALKQAFIGYLLVTAGRGASVRSQEQDRIVKINDGLRTLEVKFDPASKWGNAHIIKEQEDHIELDPELQADELRDQYNIIKFKNIRNEPYSFGESLDENFKNDLVIQKVLFQSEQIIIFLLTELNLRGVSTEERVKFLNNLKTYVEDGTLHNMLSQSLKDESPKKIKLYVNSVKYSLSSLKDLLKELYENLNSDYDIFRDEENKPITAFALASHFHYTQLKSFLKHFPESVNIFKKLDIIVNDPNDKNALLHLNNNAPLYLNRIAVNYNLVNVFKELIKANVNPNVCLKLVYPNNTIKVPILHLMVKYNETEYVHKLIRDGADIDTKDSEGHTVFDYAKDKPEILKLLKDGKNREDERYWKKFIDKLDVTKDSLLPASYQRILIEKAQEKFIRDDYLGSVIFDLVYLGKSEEEINKYLDENVYNELDNIDLYKEAVSSWVNKRYEDISKYGPNSFNLENTLDLCISNGLKRRINIILKHGTTLERFNQNDINIQDYFIDDKIDTSKPYLYSVLFNPNYKEIFKALVDHGINPNVKVRLEGQDKYFPLLHIMTRFNDLDSVAKLIKEGADIDAKDSGGLTAFDYAKDKPEILELLENNKLTEEERYWDRFIESDLKNNIDDVSSNKLAIRKLYKDSETYLDSTYADILDLVFLGKSKNDIYDCLANSIYNSLKNTANPPSLEYDLTQNDRASFIYSMVGKSKKEIYDYLVAEQYNASNTSANLVALLNMIKNWLHFRDVAVHSGDSSNFESILISMFDGEYSRFRGIPIATPLEIMITKGYINQVNTLLKYSPSFNIFDKKDIYISEYFIEDNADKSKPLLNSVLLKPSYKELFETLSGYAINANVKIRLEGQDKFFPLLHVMTRFNDSFSVLKLLMDGADPYQKDSEGYTAFDYAKDKPEILELFESHRSQWEDVKYYIRPAMLVSATTIIVGYIFNIKDFIKNFIDRAVIDLEENRLKIFTRACLDGLGVNEGLSFSQERHSKQINLNFIKKELNISPYSHNWDLSHLPYGDKFNKSKNKVKFEKIDLINILKTKLKEVQLNLALSSQAEVQTVAEKLNKELKHALIQPHYARFEEAEKQKAKVVTSTPTVPVTPVVSAPPKPIVTKSVETEEQKEIIRQRIKKENKEKENREKGTRDKKRHLEHELKKQEEARKLAEKAAAEERKQEWRQQKEELKKLKKLSKPEKIEEQDLVIDEPKKGPKKPEKVEESNNNSKPEKEEPLSTVNKDIAKKYLEKAKNEASYAFNKLVNQPKNNIDSVLYSIVTTIEKFVQIEELGGAQTDAMKYTVDLKSLKLLRNTIVRGYPTINNGFVSCLAEVSEYLTKVCSNIELALDNSSNREPVDQIYYQVRANCPKNHSPNNEYHLMDELKNSIEAFIINGRKWQGDLSDQDSKKAALYNLAKIGQIRNDLGETVFVLKNHKFFEDVLSYSYKRERNKVFHARDVKFQEFFNLIDKAKKELMPTLMANIEDLGKERDVKVPAPHNFNPSFGADRC
jgi:ankyrin repeat protein